MLLLQTFYSFSFLSFILFHFFTEMCTHFFSLETSVINLKLEHNGRMASICSWAKFWENLTCSCSETITTFFAFQPTPLSVLSLTEIATMLQPVTASPYLSDRGVAKTLHWGSLHTAVHLARSCRAAARQSLCVAQQALHPMTPGNADIEFLFVRNSKI